MHGGDEPESGRQNQGRQRGTQHRPIQQGVMLSDPEGAHCSADISLNLWILPRSRIRNLGWQYELRCEKVVVPAIWLGLTKACYS